MRRQMVLAVALSASLVALSACGGAGEDGARVSAPPVAFEPVPAPSSQARFVARGAGAVLSLGDRALTFDLSGSGPKTSRVRLGLPGARRGLAARAAQRLPGVVNDFRGRDRSKWRVGVPTYGRVRYDQVWPGVDLVVHSDRGALEYDFVVAPGTDPRAARVRLDGGGKPRIADDGSLVITAPAGRLTQRRPHVFQEVDGEEVRIPGRFVLDGRDVSFAVGDYDRTRPLVIDPVIAYSSFNGGSGADEGVAVAVGADGGPVVVGATRSTDFPLASAAGDTLNSGQNTTKLDTTVTKFSPDGASRVYSTYLGGEGDDAGLAVAAMPDGSVAIGGETDSLEFPLGPGAPKLNLTGASDGFLTRLSSTGALMTSTYYGGAGGDRISGVAKGLGNRIAVAGSTTSADLPVTSNAPQGSSGGGQDAFLAVFALNETAIDFTTYHGGSGNDAATGLAVQDVGFGVEAYLTGATTSTNLPLANAAQSTRSGSQDAFVARFRYQLSLNVEDPPTWTRMWSTYHGGGGTETGSSLALDADGDVLVSGSTTSTDLPLASAFDTTRDGDEDLFVARFVGNTGARDRSSYLGAAAKDDPGGLAVSPTSGRVWVGATETTGADGDIVVHRLSADLSARLDTTRVEAQTGDSPNEIQRGLATSAQGDAWITGRTGSTGFPTLAAVQPTFGGGTSDAFVTRLSDDEPVVPDTVITDGPTGDVAPGPVTFTFAAEPPESGSSFECAIDGGAFDVCTSPRVYDGLAPGAHTFRVRAVNAAAIPDPTPAERTFTIVAPDPGGASTPPPPPPSPPPPIADPPGDGALTGPTTLRFGQGAVYQASFPGAVSDYAWDLDGDGAFERATGARPAITAGFSTLGTRTVRVRGTGPGGTAVASLQVTVERPAIATVSVTPSRPRPGQKVTFRFARRSDASFRPLYYAWEVRGRKPGRRTLRLPGNRVPRATTAVAGNRARAAAKPSAVTVSLPDATPTANGTFTTTFSKSGVQRVEASVVGTDGTAQVVSVDVAVGTKAASGAVFGAKLDVAAQLSEVAFCATGFRECAQISADGLVGRSLVAPIGVPFALSDTTPSSRHCWNVVALGPGKGFTRKTPRALDRFDLPYPAPEKFFDAVQGAPKAEISVKASAPSKTKARSAQAVTKGEVEVCARFPSQTVAWDLGDGTTVPSPQPGGTGLAAALDVTTAPNVQHTYAKEGTYTVTLIARRFAHNHAKFPKPSADDYVEKVTEALGIQILPGFGKGKTIDADVPALVAKGILVPYLAKTQIKVFASACDTGPTTINRVPIRAFVGSTDPLDAAAKDGGLCEVLDDAGKPTGELRVLQGQLLSLNGVVVQVKGRPDSSGVIITSGKGVGKNVLTAAGAEPLALTFHTRDGQGRPLSFSAGETPVLTVPDRRLHGELKIPTGTSRPPAFGARPNITVANFRLTGGRLYFDTDGRGSAYFLATTQPDPLAGGSEGKLSEIVTGEQTAPMVLGGVPTAPGATPRATLRADAPVQPGKDGFRPVDPDFSLDLSGKKLGPLGIDTFLLAHYPADGWYGAGKFIIPVGGIDYTLDALYRPSKADNTNTAIACTESLKDGATGLEIKDTGGFRHAGAMLTGAVNVGPLELNCFAARVKRAPGSFTILGHLGGQFPPSAPEGPNGPKPKKVADFDVCALIASLDKGAKTGGCAIKPTEFGIPIEGVGVPATQDQVWIAIRGELKFVDKIKVNGGVDLRTGDDLLKIGVQAGITPIYFGPYRIGGGVFGRFIIKPQFAFAVGGDVEFCFVGKPFCVGVKALISSLGAGACADTFLVSGGFKVRWSGGGVSLFGGCNWDVFQDIQVSRASSTLVNPVDLRARPGLVPAFGASTERSLSVEGNDLKQPLAIELGGTGGRAFRGTVTAPGLPPIVVPEKAGTTVYDGKGALVSDAKKFDPTRHTRVTVMDAIGPEALTTPVAAGVEGVGPGAPAANRPVVPEVIEGFEPTTIVTVPRPKRGTWRINAAPGTVFTGVRKRRRGPDALAPKARVQRSAVSGKRRLIYQVPKIPGQRVIFTEEGRTLQREIGRTKIARGGSGSFPIPTEFGSSGRRVITATVEQGGVPVRRFTVARYVQPRPPAVPVPKRVTMRYDKSKRVQVCVTGSDGKTEHDIRVTASSGHVLVRRSAKPCVTFPELDESVSVSARVRARRSYGLSGAKTAKLGARPLGELLLVR